MPPAAPRRATLTAWQVTAARRSDRLARVDDPLNLVLCGAARLGLVATRWPHGLTWVGAVVPEVRACNKLHWAWPFWRWAYAAILPLNLFVGLPTIGTQSGCSCLINTFQRMLSPVCKVVLFTGLCGRRQCWAPREQRSFTPRVGPQSPTAHKGLPCMSKRHQQQRWLIRGECQRCGDLKQSWAVDWVPVSDVARCCMPWGDATDQPNSLYSLCSH